jgi:murein DD-endopeptidase MepM/ murein hydrolase activator NlpD
VGNQIEKGQLIASFGNEDENGHWPPHLHFQLMFDMEGCFGDYPGVGKYSEKEKYLQNIPDPNLILGFHY